MESQITEDLRQFILATCPSVPHLEALLLMRREAQREWTVSAMAQSLYTDDRRAEAVLRDLAATGLIALDAGLGAYRYAPSAPATAELVDRLAAVYSRALIAVTKLIHDRSAQLFADAFKLRKE